MFNPTSHLQGTNQEKKRYIPDWLLLVVSIFLQGCLAYFFGHAYDTRILMATGYLVANGQNPYIAQNLGAVFHNSTFQGITTLGYPPPWALVLGLVYLCSYRIIPNFLLYNLAIKLPIIAANICLAYAVRHILNKSAVRAEISLAAWIFMLFNPFLLLTTSAWGQFDSVVALLSLWSLFLLSEGGLIFPAILLALAISLKPIALPLILVTLVFLAGKSLRRALQYFAVFTLSMLLLCVVPFIIFKWNPSEIFQHWNSQFVVGGGLSFMTFLEYVRWTYQLPGQWWFLGWLWLPALGLAAYALKPGIRGFKELLKKSTALILVFYLCRAWLSETNINLILPLVLILVSMHALDRRTLLAIWVLPLIFSFFNTSLAQLFFPSIPGLMDLFLKWSIQFNTARYIIRTVVVVAWLMAGGWTVVQCYKRPFMDRGVNLPWK
jgi:Gpi18-like mannosyltransferase